MPEGPELHLASLYVNRMCAGVVFAGAVVKSEVSKSREVPFSCPAYRIAAASRGKEVKLTLTPLKREQPRARARAAAVGEEEEASAPMDVVFRFGMSGFFRFTGEDALPKHAHLRFYSDEEPRRVLSFVDARRFGSWEPDGKWQPGRGPCIMFEYQSFRENVLSNLSDRAFDRPICETLLNQKFFNGVGNYLRAEILYRLNIPPFAVARSVLDGLQLEDSCKNVKKEEAKTAHGGKTKVEAEPAGDLLRLCHTVPLEVVNLGGKGYDPEKADYSDFEAWLRCYYVDGMKSVRDHNGRTMWFTGDAGPLAPKASKTPKAKKRAKKKDDDHDYTQKKKQAAKKVAKQEVAKTPKKEKDTDEAVAAAATSKSRRKSSKAEKRGEGARRRKSSSAQTTPPPGSLRRSCRVTRQNGK